VVWTFTPADTQALAAAPWEPTLEPGFFKVAEFKLIAKNPSDAIRLGLRETHRVMMTTYLTFERLFEGSVKVVHLRGPVGIAHVGTLLAERGFVWLMFFMALISVNLAVVNFLPIPIADGGHFVFLLYEQLTGKPVSVMVQNAAAIAGLALLATMFLIVTYNDIARLFGFGG
jgi:regulator of sigma E protease